MSDRAAAENGARGWMADMLTPLLFGVGCFVLWEAAVQLLRVPMYILPPPSAIFVQFALKFPRIWEYTLVTGQETLVGFAVAILLGVPMGLLVAFSPLLRRTFYPLAVTLEMVPKIVFAPVFISWWGLGFAPKIYVVVLVCFFPIMLNGILAFTSLSVELGRFCLSTGAGPLRTFFKVRLPAALPQLFVGFKGAAVNATVGATVAEWIGSDAGPRLLHPAGGRRVPHGHRLRHHLYAGGPGPARVLDRDPGRAAAHPLARLAARAGAGPGMKQLGTERTA